jgi:hypothetical protein
LDGPLNPIFAVWRGTETVTTAFVDLFSSIPNATIIGTFDDELPPNVPGLFGDPFGAIPITVTGRYILAVSHFGPDNLAGIDPPPNGVNDFHYNLTVEATPEPGTWVLISVGLLAGGVGYRRRSKAMGVRVPSELVRC